MLPEGLCNHPDRKNHTRQQKTPHHHNQTQLTHRVTERTDIAPLRSRIAAGVRHEPPRHIEVAVRTCSQKGCVTILSMTHRAEASPLASQRNGTITSTETATTDFVSLRSRIAAGVRHEPPRHIEVTVRTCSQKGCVTILIVETTRSSRKHFTITTKPSSHTK
jgi:SOS-response transcriptional repressor LexA